MNQISTEPVAGGVDTVGNSIIGPGEGMEGVTKMVWLDEGDERGADKAQAHGIGDAAVHEVLVGPGNGALDEQAGVRAHTGGGPRGVAHEDVDDGGTRGLVGRDRREIAKGAGVLGREAAGEGARVPAGGMPAQLGLVVAEDRGEPSAKRTQAPGGAAHGDGAEDVKTLDRKVGVSPKQEDGTIRSGCARLQSGDGHRVAGRGGGIEAEGTGGDNGLWIRAADTQVGDIRVGAKGSQGGVQGLGATKGHRKRLWNGRCEVDEGWLGMDQRGSEEERGRKKAGRITWEKPQADAPWGAGEGG